MQLTFVIDTDDSEQCPDKPWTANLTIVTDDGRASEAASAGIGSTVREAIENLLDELDTDDDHAWLPRSWRLQDQASAGDDFIIVDGGLVQNDPSLPVFDLDVLSSDVDAADEIANLYDRMSEHPNQKGIAPWLRDVERHVKNV